MPWALLKIEPTSDKKAIKRAYSRLLKQTRPDEKPAEFQQLNAAYKRALKIAPSLETGSSTEPQSSYDLDERPCELGEQSNQSAVQETSVQETAVDVETVGEGYTETTIENTTLSDALEQEQEQEQELDAESEAMRQTYEEQRQQVKALLASKQRLHLPKTWYFLADSPYILDPHYSYQLGAAVFYELCQFLESAEVKHAKRFLNTAVLSYLSNLFSWTEYYQNFYEYAEEDTVNWLLKQIDTNYSNAAEQQQGAAVAVRGGAKVKKVEVLRLYDDDQLLLPNNYLRFFAWLIDFGLVVVPSFQVAIYLGDYAILSSSLETMGFTLAVVFLYTWLMETSPLQATLGKWITGLKVITKDGRRLSRWHGALRTLVYCLSSIGGKFTIIINAWMRGKFIHDRATKSYVFNYRKYKKLKRERR